MLTHLPITTRGHFFLTVLPSWNDIAFVFTIVGEGYCL